MFNLLTFLARGLQNTILVKDNSGMSYNGPYLRVEDGNRNWYMPNSQYDVSGISLGDVYVTDSYSGGSFPPNVVINEINRSFININGTNFTRIRFANGNFSGTDLSGPAGTSSGQTITLRKIRTASSYTGVNYLNYTKASYDTALAAGVVNGTLVATSDTAWPAGTRISDINLLSYGIPASGTYTQFYQVIYNSTLVSTVSSAATTTYDLSVSPYAEPGETVFSFIANPGERSTVDFSQLKELTNTPLGGRGTYPNGPDVLAINVYKVSGSATKANIILKWGEAQA